MHINTLTVIRLVFLNVVTRINICYDSIGRLNNNNTSLLLFLITTVIVRKHKLRTR